MRLRHFPVATLTCDHRQMEKRNADPAGARDRSARFGRLPARIHSEATVEMVETTPPQSLPVSAGTEEQRQVFIAGG
jgi:hypothetical protein